MAKRAALTILVATAETGDHGRQIIERAATLAAALSAKLIVFHAAFDSALSGRPFFDNKRLARSRGDFVAARTHELERHAQALRKRNIPVDVVVVWAEPAYEAIIRASVRDNVDLVIAGPHAPGRPRNAVALRHTDWQLLRLCPKPLLLVRSSAAGASGQVLAALDPTHANDKPAALDQLLLEWGASMALAVGAELHAVHSIPDSSYAMDETAPAARRTREKQLRAKLDSEIKRAGVRAAGVHVVPGRPEIAIPAIAKKLDAQLLVMGVISRRGLQRFAIGDTAERIIHTVNCDLLALKPEGFKLRLGRAKTEAITLPGKPVSRKSRAKV